MKCPHCTVEINPHFSESFIGNDVDGHWSFLQMNCPNPKCQKKIINLHCGTGIQDINRGIKKVEPSKYLINAYPITSTRGKVSEHVDPKFAQDYYEGCLILKFSPKASAALSRRCLQNILREKALVHKSDLASEIDEILANKSLPSHLSESLDAVRVIGNFAAHPIKSKTTGEIVDVEPGEAEWLLDVIESLFDFYFVQPALTKIKKDALNKKLTDSGKQPIK